MKVFYNSLIFLLLCVTVVNAQSITKNIVIDQFGYRPQDEKIAVIRNPKVGYDSDQSFIPGTTYQICESSTKKSVFEGTLKYFDSGLNGDAYGDEVWHFDFSEVQTDGSYYVLDVEKNVRSYTFRIAEDVYNSVLKDAVRMLFYQRAGCEKKAKYAGDAWADAVDHLGHLQDGECRLYNDLNNSATERDLRGGWYDAGDFNKYTVWACNYVETLLMAYLENPFVWTDDYNIPESGNGIPDLLDEVKWELDWILRMQENDGSVLSVMDVGAASPPSASTEASFYGPATTNASYAAAKACAIGYKVYKKFNNSYAVTLYNAALSAWNWAEQHKSAEFYNSGKVAAGEQEGGASVRLVQRLNASLYLYEMTGDKSYLKVFESNYKELDFVKWYNYMDQYRAQDEHMLLRYIDMENVSESIKQELRKSLIVGFSKTNDFVAMLGKDPYLSYIRHYNWGSNSHKCTCGSLFYTYAERGLTEDVDGYRTAAEHFIHYIHGVNPFAMVYLTNMNERGASNSVNQMFHSWFCNGDDWWDDVQGSLYGPAPGYLIGGAFGYYEGQEVTYTWDGCCPNGCGSKYNNSLCEASWLFPSDEPFAKRYNDFNDGWPVNSWSITEPSCGYQVNYIRLLSKFVTLKSDDVSVRELPTESVQVYPNPVQSELFIEMDNTDMKNIKLFDMQSRQIKCVNSESSIVRIDLEDVPAGMYVLQIFNRGMVVVKEIVKK